MSMARFVTFIFPRTTIPAGRGNLRILSAYLDKFKVFNASGRFFHLDDAKRAIDSLQDAKLHGRKLLVEFAKGDRKCREEKGEELKAKILTRCSRSFRYDDAKGV